MENLSESFKQHDKYQFEMKFTYPFDKSRKENEYHVETYLFFPVNLFINRNTYRKDDFFNDMQRYIRLKTPAVLLSGMTSGENSPMAKLEKAMNELSGNDSREAEKSYNERLKMFSSIMKSALRDGENFIETACHDDNGKILLENYISSINSILEKYRTLKILLQNPLTSPECMQIFQLVDEFLSVTSNKYCYRLWNFFETRPKIEWGPEAQAKLLIFLRREIAYRKRNQYPSVPDPYHSNEELLYRESTLKKVMASILFLRTTTRKDGVFLENVCFGVAAGIAMTIATGIAYLSKSLLLEEFSVVFFLILVFAYMWKDRTKEWLKAYFHQKIQRYVYDYRTNVFSALGCRVGVCKESFSFINENFLSPVLKRIRNKSYLSQIENGVLGEHIMFYRKHIILYSGNCKHLFSDFNVDGVVDIMRFNVRKFLEKMDNPAREIFAPSEEGDSLDKLRAKRVYHVNLIVRYGMRGQKDTYRRFRLILNRNGIQRIEPFPNYTE